MFPDSAEIRDIIARIPAPSYGYVAIVLPTLVVENPSRLTFVVPPDAERLAQSLGIDRFYVQVQSGGDFAWSQLPFQVTAVGAGIGAGSPLATIGFPVVIGGLSPGGLGGPAAGLTPVSPVILPILPTPVLTVIAPGFAFDPALAPSPPPQLRRVTTGVPWPRGLVYRNATLGHATRTKCNTRHPQGLIRPLPRKRR